MTANCGAAQATVDGADFSKRWFSTPAAVAERPEGKYEARIMQRLVFAGDTVFTVGNITYFKFPRQGDFKVSELAEKLRDGLGFDKWITRRVKDAYVFEYHWKSQLRFVRLYVKPEKDTILYSVAMLRTAYADSVVLESELLQRQLAGVIDGEVPWLKKMVARLHDFIISDANAQTNVCGPPCAPGNMVCVMNQANCTQNQLINQMSMFNTNMTAVNAQLGTANGNWANTNAQFAAANGNLANANAQMATANANWVTTNAEFKRSNDLLQSFMKPEKAFAWAAASAAGAAFGAIAMSMAIDALVAGGAALYELITGEKEEARILERFKKGREVWEKTSEAAADLEKAIDSVIYLKELGTQFNMSREEMLLSLGVDALAAKSEIKQTEALLEDAMKANNGACVLTYRQQIVRKTDWMNEMERLRSKLQALDSDVALCENLKKDLSKLRMAEGALQKARASILGGQNIFMKAWHKENKQAIDDFERAREKKVKDHLANVKAANDEKERLLKEQYEIRNREVSRCVRNKIPVPVISLLGEFWRGSCENQVDNTTHVGARFKKRVAEINKDYNDRMRELGREYNEISQSKDDTYAHSGTLTGELKGYNDWFDQVRNEQACLHNPQACSGNIKGVMTRFKSIEARAGRIDKACGKILGSPVALGK